MCPSRSALIMRILVFIALLLTAMLSGRAAFAHAVLLGTSPENGAVLDIVPRQVVLRFNETVTPISLTIVGRNGQVSIPAASIQARNEDVHAALPNDLRPGSYIVSYRVVSADSHPVSGSFLFSIGAPSRAAPVAPDTSMQENDWALLVILNRIVLLAGLLFSAGGVLFATYVLGNDEAAVAPLRRPLRIGAAVTLVSAGIAVVLQGGLLTATAMDASWHPLALLAVGWQSTLGTSAALIALGLLLIILRLGRRPSSLVLWLGTTGAFVAAGALAASGHAATAPPRWLAAPAMAAHGLVIAFWVGSLWPLLRLLQTQKAAISGPIVLRFSRLAVVAVGILVATGLILATLQLGGDVTALVTTPYGQLLLLKLGLVALLLLLATYNKFRLTPALASGDGHGAARLARAIRLEIAAVGLILAVTALLGQSPPPRALAAMTAQDAHGTHGAERTSQRATSQRLTAQAKGYTAMVTVSPGRIGQNTIAIAITGPDGAPFAPLAANAEISQSNHGIEPLAAPLTAVAPGRYEWVTNGFIRPGDWQFALNILINDFESATFELPVTIRE